jgi:hypothetical protein
VPEYTLKQHALVGKEPDASRVDAWEKELTPRQIEIFEFYTGDLLRYLGYPLRYGLKARKPAKMEWLTTKMQERYRQGINSVRHPRRIRESTR